MKKLITILVIIFILAVGVYIAAFFLPHLATELVINQILKGNPAVRSVTLKKVHFVSLDKISFEDIDVFTKFPGAKAIHVDSVNATNMWSNLFRRRYEGECAGGGTPLSVTFYPSPTGGGKSFRLEIASPWLDIRQFADNFVKPLGPALQSMEQSGRGRFSLMVDTDFAAPPAVWISLELDKADISSKEFSIRGCSGKLTLPLTVQALNFVDPSESGNVFAENLSWPPYNISNVSANVFYGKDGYSFSDIKFSCYNGSCDGEIKVVPRDNGWAHIGRGTVKNVSLEVLSGDVRGPVEGSQGIIEGSFGWEGLNDRITYLEGSFVSKKPGGRLQASFLRTILDYMPENEARKQAEEALRQGDFFYFTEGSLSFLIKEEANFCNAKLDLIGETVELKIDFVMTLDDLKALFRVKELIKRKFASPRAAVIN